MKFIKIALAAALVGGGLTACSSPPPCVSGHNETYYARVTHTHKTGRRKTTTYTSEPRSRYVCDMRAPKK